MIEIHASGIVFIGDPHVSSRTPGRRLDEDFCMTVCGKLEEAFRISNGLDYFPIILGDLFDDERDSKPLMLTRVIRALSVSTKTPLTLVGNHEKTQFYLTDDTALAALREADVIRTLERNGFCLKLVVKDKVILIGGTPYGQDFPLSVKLERESHKADFVIWLSHHDLAFKSAYPGSSEIVEIEGVDMLVNGHMHKTTPSVKVGAMTAHNPGNITRMSIDCKDHVPSIWSWAPENGVILNQIPLTYKKDVINLDGYVFNEIKELSTNEAKADLLIQESTFARLMMQHKNEDSRKTDDAVLLKEDMDALHLEMGNDDSFKAYVLEMLEEALREDK